ncbi:MAG: 30S ribosomal protein S12 methylthiotransferase RimO [Candidatus Xenobia bacterium]
MKFHLVSLGCPKNLVDSEIMLGSMTEAGHAATANADDADVIIVNTCAFIQRAKEESINTVLGLAQKKEDAACKLLVVTGCLPQRYKDQLPKQMPEVDVWIGTDEFPHVARIVDRAISGDRVLAFTEDRISYESQTSRPLTTPRHWAYMKVAEGCDHTCRFCIIPTIRGKFRSRSIDSLVTEARGMAEKGVRELVLVAQDITDYGRDQYGRRALGDLLRGLAGVDGIEWIRIMYAYPTSLDDNTIEAIATVDKVCKYVDMPLQHASRKMLHAMARPGHADFYLKLLEKIRTRIPGVALRSSFIVGFPGETDEDVQELETFLKAAQMDRVGVFTYSREEDTPGYQDPHQVPARAKQQRFKHLMEVQQQISLSRNVRHVGQTLRVLIDEEVPQNARQTRRREDAEAGVTVAGVKFPRRTRFVGRTEYDAPEIDGVVFITDDDARPGEFVPVTIDAAQAYDLIGRVSTK